MLELNVGGWRKTHPKTDTLYTRDEMGRDFGQTGQWDRAYLHPKLADHSRGPLANRLCHQWVA